MGIRQYGQTEVYVNTASDGNHSISNNEVFCSWGIRLCTEEEDGELLLLRENDVVSFYRLNGIERTVVVVPSYHRCWVPLGTSRTVFDEMPKWLLLFPIRIRWFLVRILMVLLSLQLSYPMLAVWDHNGELVWVGSIASNPPSMNRILACFWSWRKNMVVYLVEDSPMALSMDGIELSGSPACRFPDGGLMRFAWFPENIPATQWLRFFQEVPAYRVTLERTLTFRCD